MFRTQSLRISSFLVLKEYMCILAGSFELIYFLKISLKYLINQYHIINDVKHGQVTGKSGLCKLAHFFYQNTFITCNINASILPLLLYTKESSYSLIINMHCFHQYQKDIFMYTYIWVYAHMNMFKWPFLITCCPSSVSLSINISHFVSFTIFQIFELIHFKRCKNCSSGERDLAHYFF